MIWSLKWLGNLSL